MTKRHRVSGEEALEQAFYAIDHRPLLEKLGVELPDAMLKLALTHRSFANENGFLPNNERLEFLGDAVLGLSVAARLYEQYPDRAERDISTMRASIVSRYGLAALAREIDLGPHILLGRGELLTDGPNKDSILADTTEAVLGAIYLVHGFEVARQVVMRLCQHRIDAANVSGRIQDWKTELQERAAAAKLSQPLYEATSEGPEHNQTFTAQVIINEKVLGEGTGHSKKQAEQAAACQALNYMREHRDELAQLLGDNA